MKTEKYSTSFTVGGGLVNESVLFAEHYFEIGDWQNVRDLVEEKNLLQARTKATLGRLCREIVSRLKLLADDELKLLLEGSHLDRSQVLWLGICKRHHFVRDFAIEVVREKFLKMQPDLLMEDYDAFYDSKAEWHPELERLGHATRLKLRRTTFQMMRDTGIIDNDHKILATVMSPSALGTIRQHSAEYLSVFPMANT